MKGKHLKMKGNQLKNERKAFENEMKSIEKGKEIISDSRPASQTVGGGQDFFFLGEFQKIFLKFFGIMQFMISLKFSEVQISKNLKKTKFLKQIKTL